MELVGEVSVDDLCVGVGETREPCGVIKQCDEREMYKVKDEKGRGERERERERERETLPYSPSSVQ